MANLHNNLQTHSSVITNLSQSTGFRTSKIPWSPKLLVVGLDDTTAFSELQTYEFTKK